MAPSKIVAWECGSCTYTNKGSEPGSCIMCNAERLICYAIVAGTPAAATATRTTVNRCKQARVAALSAPTDKTALVATESTGETAAVARPLMHMSGEPNREAIVVWLVHTLVDTVGTGARSQNHSCMHHDACGIQVGVYTKVMFCCLPSSALTCVAFCSSIHSHST
jgi:hypothetical protein